MTSDGATMFAEYFRLKPTRAAKVSEISEATAAAVVPAEERVNFHIGNPVQEPRLSSAYLRVILGLDIRDESLSDEDPRRLLQALGWADSDRPLLEFFIALVRKSGPYLPRGGFPRSAPSPLAQLFNEWLLKQAEPLTYDLGTTTGRREIILASGGPVETLRVLLHALSLYLAHAPAHVFTHGTSLPAHLRSFENIIIEQLPADEHDALGRLIERTEPHARGPSFIVLGSRTAEETRRALRAMSLERPLFFIEVNDAPNHRSLAREARLSDRVLRILTPAVFDARLGDLSLTFVAGNAEYISLLETLHFQLKGTPSASEVELLAYLLKRLPPSAGASVDTTPLTVEAPLEGGGSLLDTSQTFSDRIHAASTILDSVVRTEEGLMTRALSRFTTRAERGRDMVEGLRLLPSFDQFAGLDTRELVLNLADHVGNGRWASTLHRSLIEAFVRHHPEYNPDRCVVVSGSARTGLGLLGFHCGITEVVTPDLGWTYEHCFPSVAAVPLTPDYEIDVEGLIRTVQEKLATDPQWSRHGAVVLNNPHNATGRVFSPGSVKALLRWLLGHGIRVIDDLSYQNVAPSEELPEIPTVRQLADELARSGMITGAEAEAAITVHSLSKTDCLAGARLSIAEIRQPELLERFRTLLATIRPNLGAEVLAYLFYRTSIEIPRAYWRLRNRIFLERMNAISEAMRNLPTDRNPYAIELLPPTGSMYPLMIIHKLPPGLSLEWVASGLARQGIGMIPLSTFARTESGFETGRKAFRLTLGGTDGASTLLSKTRRVLIDLNRLIGEEQAHYRKRSFRVRLQGELPTQAASEWAGIERQVRSTLDVLSTNSGLPLASELTTHGARDTLLREYLPERLATYRQRYQDRHMLSRLLIRTASSDGGRSLQRSLERELTKDNLHARQEAFRNRSFDRTVHPTQMYGLRTELAFDGIIASLLRGTFPDRRATDRAARELLAEFLALNVAVSSSEEAEEVVLDLNAHIDAEVFTELQDGGKVPTFLSFWGDWDGSNRPSGQGHRLVAAVLLDNVTRLAHLLSVLAAADTSLRIAPDLLTQIAILPRMQRRFMSLLNEITTLTHQLEGRYRGLLPFHAAPGRARRVGMALHIARDPVSSLWRHNDRLERRMRELRLRRRQELEYYFALNKRLRKELHGLIPAFQRNATNPAVVADGMRYRDLLRRFVLTPRIHQRLITAEDPFAIDTTVFNLNEINEISGRYGNPGMVLALQVSMSTRAEALIALDRKLRAQRSTLLRDNPEGDLPSVLCIPLFEGPEAVQGIPAYLSRLWEYALQSRRMEQDARERFVEIVPEIFIAGSDLSQQISQAAGAFMYRQAKRELMLWLAERRLSNDVRLKMGSGEPMQRQGGYYNQVSGTAAFDQSPDSRQRFDRHLRESTRTSGRYATTPLLGVFAGADLRTFQSALSERLRFLPAEDRAQLLFHVREGQRIHRRDLVRACEELAESRLKSTRRGEQSLERLTIGTPDNMYEEFLKVCTENFRQILYGREEDVVGIHAVSYFIARTSPPLRDRPTVRPTHDGKDQGNRILERIAETIPFARYGSLLRAIAHNQAQTAVLGVNQLTTGLFRALDLYARQAASEGDPETFIADRLLPHLPVYEILHTLRIYHDPGQPHLMSMERAFPAGNSAFLALREDGDAMRRTIPLLQQELLRRHGVDVSDFFVGMRFVPDLLPTVRPDLAVLLQPDLFTTDIDELLGSVTGRIDSGWRDAVIKLLAIPAEIRRWRSYAWTLLDRPVFQRVASFVELAVSLNSIAGRGATAPVLSREIRLPSRLAHFFRASRSDDEMRQFLAAATDYLAAASEGMIEVPATIVRAMKEVERIAAIEEQALTVEQQHRLRFYLLQIARLAGENG